MIYWRLWRCIEFTGTIISLSVCYSESPNLGFLVLMWMNESLKLKLRKKNSYLACLIFGKWLEMFAHQLLASLYFNNNNKKKKKKMLTSKFPLPLGLIWNVLTLKRPMTLLYRNQLIDLLCKSVDCFLYMRGALVVTG